MPPKIKVTKRDIIEMAIRLTEKSGYEAVNARSVARELGCSTQPIFSNFTSMEELEEEVVLATYELYSGFLKREVESGKHPPYKSMGRAYIRFAKEKRELFKLLFMRDRGGKELIPTPDFITATEIIMKNNGISLERAELMHLEMWATVHGIATMIATSFFTPSEELISDMLSDVYQGLCNRNLSEERR